MEVIAAYRRAVDGIASDADLALIADQADRDQTMMTANSIPPSADPDFDDPTPPGSDELALEALNREIERTKTFIYGDWTDEHDADGVIYATAYDPNTFREVSDKERTRLTAEKKAMPDGSFPVADINDLHNAIRAVGRAKDPDAVKAFLKRRAADLGEKAQQLIPESWATLSPSADPASARPRLHLRPSEMAAQTSPMERIGS
jgi:hypothetical protein